MLQPEFKAKAARRLVAPERSDGGRLGGGGHYPQHRLTPRDYVCRIESVHNRNQHQVGQTADLTMRICDHNSGRSRHTARYRPWHIACHLGFAESEKAMDFGRYPKSGSGKTFLKRHFP